MGLFDWFKKLFGNATEQVTGSAAQSAPHHAHLEQVPELDAEPEEEAVDESQLDLAGFDPRDEEAFFNAVLQMESEGQFGGTDQSRAEIMARFGIRNHSHWQHVKDSVYTVLIRHYGSAEEVGQREMNWRTGQIQQHMQGQAARMAAGGGFEPVEGVSLEAWAAINAAMVGGSNLEDLLKGAGIDKARWDRVSAEWNARMARDTTATVAMVYGNAFQAASQGKYSAYAREAAAARAANRDISVEPPISYEQYYEIMYEQAYATKQGRNPVDALKAYGLTIVDWTDLGSFFGYHFVRNAGRDWKKYEEIHKRVEAKYAAKYPGVKADVDIAF